LAATCIPRSSFPSIANNLINLNQFAHGEWGILIQRNNGNGYETFYEHRPDEFVLPASNNKVVTTAPAFLTLGPNWTLETKIFGTVNPTDESAANFSVFPKQFC